MGGLFSCLFHHRRLPPKSVAVVFEDPSAVGFDMELTGRAMFGEGGSRDDRIADYQQKLVGLTSDTLCSCGDRMNGVEVDALVNPNEMGGILHTM